MPIPNINPAHILNSYRKTDAVIIVCQNNSQKTVEISAINEEAARIIGYKNEELVGKQLATILPDRLISVLSEFIEYDDDHQDLLAVLNKIRNFAVKLHDGSEKEFRLRIIRGESAERNPWFHLLLIDEEQLLKFNAFRSILQENFKGHEVIDSYTGLPDRASLFKDLELVVYHVRNKELSAVFALVDTNQYEKICEQYGEKICHELQRHIGQICKLKLRPEDTIGVISPRTLGIIMVDLTLESARAVLNRLRWAIGVTPMALPLPPSRPSKEPLELVAQVNINFLPINNQINDSEIIATCEKFMQGARNTINNSVQLVVAEERRSTREERRKVFMNVEHERRQASRRKKE